MQPPHHREHREIPAASCPLLGSGDDIIAARTSTLIGAKPGVSSGDAYRSLAPAGRQVKFRNYYRCKRCSCEWMDIWSALVEDDVPIARRAIFLLTSLRMPRMTKNPNRC